MLKAMRINKYLALATGISRRAADRVITSGRVTINGRTASNGDSVAEGDRVRLDEKLVTAPLASQTIMFHKPVGYVCSRDGQGSKTIYDLLPQKLHHLKAVGRLDKDSSGLLLLTNDGNLAHKLTHPSFQKVKVYTVVLDKPLTQKVAQQLRAGIALDDGVSQLQVRPILKSKTQSPKPTYEVRLREGRNRQIRRTFAAAGYQVIKLHRTEFGQFKLDYLPVGQWQFINQENIGQQ